METKVQSLVGGWTPYHKLTKENKTIFDEALKDILGVNYSPNQVSTQVVAGTNYRFKCTAYLPYSKEITWEAVIEIFEPLVGSPHIVNITRI